MTSVGTLANKTFLAKEYVASIRNWFKEQGFFYFIDDFGGNGAQTQFPISSFGERDVIFKDTDKYIECVYNDNDLNMDDVSPLNAAVICVSLAACSTIGPTQEFVQFFNQALCVAAFGSADPASVDPALPAQYDAINGQVSIISSTNKRSECDCDFDDDMPTQPTKRRKTCESSTATALTIHHEHQESHQCGKHAVNAIVAYAGKPIYGVDDMQLIARDKTNEQRALGLQDNEIEVMSDSTGNYNQAVVIHALKHRLGFEMDHFHLHTFIKDGKITDDGLSALMEKKGVVICKGMGRYGGHWFSLLPHSAGYLINMDSLLQEPQVLDKDQVRILVDDVISSPNKDTTPSIYFVPDDKSLIPTEAATYVTNEAPKQPQRVQPPRLVKTSTETIRRRFVKAKRPRLADCPPLPRRKTKVVRPTETENIRRRFVKAKRPRQAVCPPLPRRKSKVVRPPRRKLKAVRPKRGTIHPQPAKMKQVRWNLNRKRCITDGVEVESPQQRPRLEV